MYAWLAEIGLAEYCATIKQQGYDNIHDLSTLTKDDLHELGITKQMHIKKILNKTRDTHADTGEEGIQATLHFE